MKRNLLRMALCVIVLALAACRTAAPEPTSQPVEDPAPMPTDVPPVAQSAPAEAALWSFDVDWDDRSLFREGLVEAEQGVLDDLPGASVYHINLHIADDLLLLEGYEKVRYTNREDEPLDVLYFRLFANTAGGAANVSGVKVDGQEVEPIYEFEDSAIRLPLPEALQPGEQAVVEMFFTVDVAVEMGGNYGLFGYFDGVLVLDEFYPVVPAYDDEGWNVEVPPPNGDVTHFDASFYLVRVTAPAGLMIVASGVEVERQEEGDQQVVTFAAGPARDFYIAASERFEVFSTMVGETTVNSYAVKGLVTGRSVAAQYAVNAVESYGERLGPYPYTELDVVGTPMQAGGMEYPGLVAVNVDYLDPANEISGLSAFTLLESTTAHEVAHQWFYNVVGNDQVDEPWLDEPLVQYMTGLYFVDTYNEEAAASYRDWWDYFWGQADYEPIPIGMPSGDYVRSEYGPILYGRGPMFVSALAEEMGQETFDAFLRDYYETHKWKIGSGEAFRQLAEEHCACDLGDLFEEWVYAE